MREQIAILVKLQTIDSDIKEIEKRLGKVAGKRAILDLELEEFESTIKEKISVREEYQKRYRSLESDANMNLPKITKSKEKPEIPWKNCCLKPPKNISRKNLLKTV